MSIANNETRFEETVLVHLDAAYNLARWLTRNHDDAEDVVQEACLRAFKFFGGFRGGDSRAWLLSIVRNTCYTWLQRNRMHELTVPFEESEHDIASIGSDPAVMLLQHIDAQLAHAALESLPVEFREVIVLRELEEMAYKEIAHICGVPLGTVMSRLARARQRLQQYFAEHADAE